MKPAPTSNRLSPPGRASPSGVAKPSTQLPISRSNTSAWEKPERARTSHACEPCRERKTKCDGERPSCRRCLHTGTSCHYGYGKGWRKRKTAEDLTATSRRLVRYENLLSQILPMVSSDVRLLIEDARDQQDAPTSNGSETTETEHNFPTMSPALKAESSTSSTGSRILLPLPIPSPLAPTISRTSNPPSTFDPVPPITSTVAPPMAAPTPGPQPNLSPDMPSLTRLPSITPDGLLIEGITSDRSPPRLHRLSDPKINPGPDQVRPLPTSPTGQACPTDVGRRPLSPG